MKKVYQSKQQKRHRARRARRELKKKRRSGGGGTHPQGRGSRQRDAYEPGLTERVARSLPTRCHVRAPAHFSFVRNTDEVSAFYEDLRSKACENEKVFVDLRPTRQASVDAFTVLSCIASDMHHEHGTQFVLGWPLRAEVRSLLRRSGFEEAVGGGNGRYAASTSGTFSRRHSNKVEPEAADEMVEFASAFLFGGCSRSRDGRLPAWARRKKTSAYRTIVECMSNTKGHASKDGGEFEDWWMSAFFDRKRGVAEFAFVDNGVGILKSGNVTRYKRVVAKISGRTSADLLQDALDGKIPSQTKQEGRGEGLPAMQRDCREHGVIDGLTIITNDVRISIADDIHDILGNDFSGTFIYWELSTGEVNP